jgi:hypothetical protein
VKASDRAPYAETDAVLHLLQLRHIVREEDQHRAVGRIGLPPAAIGAGPSDGNFKNRDELFIALGQRHWAPIKPDVKPGATFAQAMRALAKAALAAVEERQSAAVGRLTGLAFTLKNPDLRTQVHDVTERSYEFGAEWLGTDEVFYAAFGALAKRSG